MHTYIHTYIHAYIHTYMHAYIHTYIHIYIHACMDAYMLRHIVRGVYTKVMGIGGIVGTQEFTKILDHSVCVVIGFKKPEKRQVIKNNQISSCVKS